MIQWSLLRTKEDAELLSEFECAEPAPATFGPEDSIEDLPNRYELEAQIGLQREVSYPLLGGDFVLLGRDERGLAAALWWSEQGGPAYVHLQSMGVALRLRGQKLGVGDAMIDEFLFELADRAVGADERSVQVRARVDWDNSNCQELLRRKGFRYLQSDGFYQQWWLTVTVPGPDD